MCRRQSPPLLLLLLLVPFWQPFLATCQRRDSPSSSSPASITAPPSASSTATRDPITRTVEVGKVDHEFDPDVVQASVGDFVEFRFFPPNHSVVRAPYEHPCIPYEMVETDQEGFSSGFYPVDAILKDPPVWEIEINDTDPIFYYCSAPGSCINYGMVGVINPNRSTSLSEHRSSAKEADYMLQPGEEWPSEAEIPDEEEEEDAPDSLAEQTPASDSDSSPALGPGAIAGIVIGSAVVFLLAAALIYFCGRDRALASVVRPRSQPALVNDFDHGTAQYVRAVPKHSSGMTVASTSNETPGYFHQSPALPGYTRTSDRFHPPARPYFPPSDAPNPAGGPGRTPSPGSATVPAYSRSIPFQSFGPTDHGGEDVHEIDGTEGNNTQRRNSISKGGVERYS